MFGQMETKMTLTLTSDVREIAMFRFVSARQLMGDIQDVDMKSHEQSLDIRPHGYSALNSLQRRSREMRTSVPLCYVLVTMVPGSEARLLRNPPPVAIQMRLGFGN